MSPIYFITHHSPYSFGITPPAPHQKVILSFSAIALFAGVRLTTAAIFVHKLIPKFATRSNKRKKTSFSLSNSLFIIVGWKLTEWINIWAIIVEQHILRPPPDIFSSCTPFGHDVMQQRQTFTAHISLRVVIWFLHTVKKGFNCRRV